MKNLRSILRQTCLSAGREFIKIIIIMAIAVPFISLFADFGPTSSPPDGNAAAPINVGVAFQTKSGGIELKGGLIASSIIDKGALLLSPFTPDFSNPVVNEAMSKDGVIYYDSTAKKFRCYEDESWKDCVGIGGSGGLVPQIQIVKNEVLSNSGWQKISVTCPAGTVRSGCSSYQSDCKEEDCGVHGTTPTPANGCSAYFDNEGKNQDIVYAYCLQDPSYVPPPPPLPSPTQCSDGLDNDGDGKTDYPADPGCSSETDNDETNQGAPVGITFSKTCNDFTFAISGESGSRAEDLTKILDGKGRIVNVKGNVTYNNSGKSYDVNISVTWGFFCISFIEGTAYTR